MQSRYVVVIALLIGAAAYLPPEATASSSICYTHMSMIKSQCLDVLYRHMLKYDSRHSLEATKRGLCDGYIAHFECLAQSICRYCAADEVPSKYVYEAKYRQDLAVWLDSPSCVGIKVNFSLETSYCDYLDSMKAEVTTEVKTTMASTTPITLANIPTKSATTMPSSIELDINNYFTTASALPADRNKKSAPSPVVEHLVRIVVLTFVVTIAIGLLAVWMIKKIFKRSNKQPEHSVLYIEQAEEVNDDFEMIKL